MIVTNWGYSLLDVDALPDILTVNDFNAMTANRFALDGRVVSTLKSVTAAVRNYCGWHIATSQRCELVINIQDLQFTTKYSDLILQLPYKFVTNIESVIINAKKEVVDEETIWVGDNITDFNYKYSGSLTLYDAAYLVDSRKTNVVIIATVGVNDTDALKSLIATKASHILSGTYGVQSETAGGLSVSYNSSFVNGAKANAFMTDDKELLNSYKITELL